MAAANNATAKNPYVPQSSVAGGDRLVTCSPSRPHGGSSAKNATTNTTSASPARPKTRSIGSNLTRHNTTHSTKAVIGTHSR